MTRHPDADMQAPLEGYQAAECWLQALQGEGRSSATLDTYRRELRRVRWYAETQGAPDLLSWSCGDAARYVEFLRTQAHLYICPTGLRPGAEGWTPFRSGALDPTSIDSTARILGTMYRHFAGAGVAVSDSNPFEGLGNAALRRRSKPEVEPTLNKEIVARALDRIAAEPKTTESQHQRAWRDRFILTILSRTTLSTSDLAKARMSDIHVTTAEQSAAKWTLAIIGRDAVALDSEVVEMLGRYRKAFYLRPMPSPGELWGLVLSPYKSEAQCSSQPGSPEEERGRRQWKSVTSRQTIWAIVRAALSPQAA